MIGSEMVEGMLPPPMVAVNKADYDQLIVVLKWVKDNPGCHPENIRSELLKLHTRFVK